MSKARELANLGNAYSDGALSNRNLIINGAMQVAQRGTSASGITSTGYYTSDRWRLEGNTDAAFTMENVSDAPEGFGRSTKVTVTTADTSIGATQYSTIAQRIEAQNLLQLKYGTSSAQDVTVSFWVKSSTTDAFAVSIEHGETAAYISQTLTINAANTWEYKTFTFVGNTSTAINTDNGTGLYLYFMLAAGSTYNTGASSSWSGVGALGGGVDNAWIGTTNATFQITGVQLEVGDTATPFEHRSYGQELALCQRYYEKWSGSKAMHPQYSSEAAGAYAAARELWNDFKVEKRANPSVTVSGTHSPSAVNASIYGLGAQASEASSTASVRISAWTADAEL